MSRAESQHKPMEVTRRPLIGIGQVAEWLGVGERHVRRLISERRIPYVRWGHYIRFDPVQIDEWLRSNRIAPMRSSGVEGAMDRSRIHERPSVWVRTLEDANSGEEEL